MDAVQYGARMEVATQKGFAFDCLRVQDADDTCLSPSEEELIQCPLPPIDPDRIVDVPERILAHVVGVPLVYPAYQGVRVRHARVREEQELGARQRLEHGEFEEIRLQTLDARGGNVGDRVAMMQRGSTRTVGGRGGRLFGRDRVRGEFGRERLRYRVDAVERSGQDEVVVGRQIGGAWKT